jgi:hypothetical protein
MTPDRLHEIERVFHEARERPLPERAAWLAEIGRDDPDLAREVASLLAEPRWWDSRSERRRPAWGPGHHSVPIASRP